MKKITFSMTFLFLISIFATATTGWYSDFVKLNVNAGAEAYYWIGTDPGYGTELQGAALGSLTSLEITGCDMKYWSDTQDRLGGAFYYKVTNVAGTVDYIAATEIVWDQVSLGGNDYQGTNATTIDLLASLPYGTGSYKLQVWAKHWGSDQADSWLSNTGANYVATFSYTKTNPASFTGTYKVGESTGTNFTSLSAAVSALNAGTIIGNVVLEITSDITETTDIKLGVNNSYNLTIKPALTVNPTITFTLTTNVGGASIDGCFSIGSPTGLNTNLVSTNNIIIDGSNTVDGITKNLTFLGPVMSTQKSVFRIFGNNDNITIKNCIITNRSTSGSTTTPINVTNYNSASTNFIPDNLTIDNNTLSSTSGNGGLGISLSVSGTPTVGMTGMIVSNNIVSHAGTRGIMCNYVNDANIFGNQITATVTQGASAAAGIWLSTGTGTAGTFNIYNNKFSNLSILNNTAAASNGYIAIDNQFATPKIVNIYNNFITGFKITAAVSNSKLYGVRQTGSSTTNVYNNTIVIPEMTNMTAFGSSYIAGIAFATAATTEATPTGSMTVKNNIIISNETGMKTWGIRRVGTGGTFTSNNNNIYRANATYGFVGYSNASDASDLAAWKIASSQDAGSISKDVSFVSATDLSLTGASINDIELGAPRIASVLTDNIGTSRGTTTYMGAHEVGAIVSAAVNASDITILNNVAVTSTGHLTLDQDKTLVNVSLEAGAKVTLNDTKQLETTNLTIKSALNNTGTFVNKNATGGLIINETKSVQQYLASARNWYMSSPISDAKVLAGYTYYQYNEPNGSLATNWTEPTLASDLTVGRGYIIKPTGEDTYNFTTTSGDLNDGNYPVTIYRTDGVTKAGFNLLGNPYPSYINVDNLVNSDVESSYWYRVRNVAETGWAYDTYNIPSALSTGNSGKAVSKYISPMQAFWLRVKSSSTPASLTFTNALREHKDDVNNNFRAPAVNKQSVLRLKVTSGINSDETIVYFNDNASNGYDAYDSPKMTNGETSGSPDLYTMIGTEQLVINGMNTIPTEIPLYFKANASTASQFSISATEFSNFENGTKVYIKDNNTGFEQLISESATYNFDATATPNFSVVFKAPGVISGFENNNTVNFNVYANAKGQLTVSLPLLTGNDVVAVYNSTGRRVMSQTLTSTQTLLNNTFATGVYVVKVNEVSHKVIVK